MKNKTVLLKLWLLLFLLVFSSYNIFSQTIQITANPGQSTNILIGPSNYHVSENIYTENEIGAANFTSIATAINHIDFNIISIGSPSTVNNYKIYLKEVPLSSTIFTTGVYDLAGYTLVFNGTFLANATGWVGVDLSTNFMRTSGNNLQLLIERLDNTLHGIYNINATRGNDTDASLNSSRRINTTTMPVPGSTNLNTVSAFRPQVQLRHINLNDAAVTEVYTLGKLPIPFANPHVISANITNNGAAALTNLPVTLNITGANSFTNIQTIATLASGASTTIAFAAFSPTNTGNNTVSVSIPADDYTADNIITIPQQVSNNAYSYAYSTVPTGSVGSNSSTIDFVAKFTSSSATSINQVGVNFASGGLPFKIGIWDKAGTGFPGNLLWESTTQLSTSSVFTLPINPPVAITDTFYIGVRQTSSSNIQFSYQNETPIRPNTFFFTAPSGTSTWADFAPGNPFKFMIEPRLTIANDVGVATINNPVASTSIDNCGISPQTTVVNFGSNNQTSAFNITFNIKQNGSVVYSDTKSLSLNSGESQNVNFAQFNGSVNGTDSSIVYTSLLTDGARNNDTLYNRFTTDNYSYAGATAASGLYAFANSTSCAAASTFKPTYNWITETSNEVNWATNGDDSVLANAINLPFTFNFFGANYSQFWICSNGWISFNNPTTLSSAVTRTPVSIPTAGGIENYIAGILSDLDLTNADYPDAHTYYGGDASRFVITFLHAHLFGSAEYISFQIILYADGNIIIQYNEAETTIPKPYSIINSCSAGIENTSGTQGILYRLNGNRGPIFGSPLAVQYRPTGIIPVNLISFTAQKNLKVNNLYWSTSQEINSLQFIIERSADGRSFSAIGKVFSNRNSNSVSNYTFTDENPLRGINYYRLQIVNADQSKTYSSIKSLKNSAFTDASIYPNPVKEQLTVNITTDIAEVISLIITDASGKILITKTANLVTGSNNIPISTHSIAKGIYHLKIQLGTDRIIRKFIKN